MSFIPKNAKQLLKSAKLMRQYALNPYGLKAPVHYKFPKPKPVYKFFQHQMIVHRPGESEKIQQNTIVFKLKDQQLSKPQIKQYLQKLYGLKITKINTARFMGKVVKNHYRRVKYRGGFKKAFVVTEHKIPSFLNEPVL